MVYKSTMQIGKHKKILRKTSRRSSRYSSFTVAFAMPDHSVHLMFSKILPYQASAKTFLFLSLYFMKMENGSFKIFSFFLHIFFVLFYRVYFKKRKAHYKLPLFVNKVKLQKGK